MRLIVIRAGLSSALISLFLRRQYGPEVKLIDIEKEKDIGKHIFFPFYNEQIITS